MWPSGPGGPAYGSESVKCLSDTGKWGIRPINRANQQKTGVAGRQAVGVP
jgi:hypothetical protein